MTAIPGFPCCARFPLCAAGKISGGTGREHCACYDERGDITAMFRESDHAACLKPKDTGRMFHGLFIVARLPD
jgi:hypothetical protein